MKANRIKYYTRYVDLTVSQMAYSHADYNMPLLGIKMLRHTI